MPPQVAFGTVTQLVLEGRPQEELDTVYGFCCAVGLPVTLAQARPSSVLSLARFSACPRSRRARMTPTACPSPSAIASLPTALPLPFFRLAWTTATPPC